MVTATFADKVTFTRVWNEIKDLTWYERVVDEGIATLQ
jgi:hypothetical protein